MLSLNQSDWDRYWSKVKVLGLDQCWPWLRAFTLKGYGVFSVSENNVHCSYNAQRVGLALRLGKLPDDIHALHSCNHPWCQNPCHVYPGTNQDNIDYKMEQGRHRGARGERCKQHKLVTSQIHEIRALYLAGEHFQKTIAKMFGVNQQQISRIVNRRRWAHI